MKRRIRYRKQHQVLTFGTFSVLILVLCSSRGGSIRKCCERDKCEIEG